MVPSPEENLEDKEEHEEALEEENVHKKDTLDNSMFNLKPKEPKPGSGMSVEALEELFYKVYNAFYGQASSSMSNSAPSSADTKKNIAEDVKSDEDDKKMGM